ncbi:DUF4123 domain-containing protein [uncultured Methylobacterium sp.]|uniref:DUF4123 domain-containing protein n=1 Tax=uncultured Methylobacterium sp. TaxID=157278 RepID=UPI00259AACDA|nr:DUF4123 domain-containing protein [uncultured Methylobacterium sp.]
MTASGEAPSVAAQRLVGLVAGFGVAGFAVLDGAQFDDLPAALRQAGLLGRSLFLDQGDAELERAGPWLVALAQAPDAADQVFRLAGDRPAAVFWCCIAGEAVLYRHLRRINKARIPAWSAAGRSAPSEDDDGTFEAVLFRHWDPDVLGALMPILDAGQFSRVLGPASEIAYRSEAYGGLKRVPADPGWPVAPAGMLTIRTEQMLALGERRIEACRRSVASYLRDVADGALDGIAEADLRAHVLASEARARELGIVTEAGHCRWAFLMMITRGGVGTDPAVAAFVRNGARLPDEQVEDIMDATARAVRGPIGGRP